jgi:hypothetical protein
MRNGPKTDAVYDLPPNSPVLVWREGNIGHSGYWDGPFTLLIVKGEMCTIKLINRPTPFYFIVVKLYLQLELTEEPTPYNTVKYKEPAQINKPTPPLQEVTP